MEDDHDDDNDRRKKAAIVFLIVGCALAAPLDSTEITEVNEVTESSLALQNGTEYTSTGNEDSTSPPIEANVSAFSIYGAGLSKFIEAYAVWTGDNSTLNAIKMYNENRSLDDETINKMSRQYEKMYGGSAGHFVAVHNGRFNNNIPSAPSNNVDWQEYLHLCEDLCAVQIFREIILRDFNLTAFKTYPSEKQNGSLPSSSELHRSINDQVPLDTISKMCDEKFAMIINCSFFRYRKISPFTKYELAVNLHKNIVAIKTKSVYETIGDEKLFDSKDY
ncbi:uncharacterized protein LOC129566790 isoform X2 [Sitodiplosis mosellana]|uniref:uncharacterized protein LOC129566790 isoform X2 n=1 Tax=Sitodiplosis mosellana TaxID=263140 RepID=UPI002443DBD3|nr:uncharacterized protein LOC129566790 isoform X2 [Sitodiplosis mosellana]